MGDIIQNDNRSSRWSEWLKDQIYIDLLDDITSHITTRAKEDKSLDYFTPHDSGHCMAVEKIVKALINQGKLKRNLNDLEIFILFVAVWTHDIGMLTNVAKNYLKKQYSPEDKREIHERISSSFMQQDEEFKQIFKDRNVNENLVQNWINTVSIISKFHRRKYNLEDCPCMRHVKGIEVQARLLACILRLGDTLHIDSSRYDRPLFNILQIGNFDRTARLHWLKSKVVSNVFLDDSSKSINVLLDLPDIEDYRKELLLKYSRDFDKIEDTIDTLKTQLLENAKHLQFIIKENILEDVNAVKEIFKNQKIACYESVNVKINFCPGMPKVVRDEITDILNDLDILLSPNTSRVMSKALASVLSLSQMDPEKFNTYENFYNHTEQLLDSLNKIYDQRKCHIGLHKIIIKLKEEFDKFPSKSPKVENVQISLLQKKLEKFADNISQQRKRSIQIINKKASKHMAGLNNVFLFGFSQIVLGFLKCGAIKLGVQDKINLYVFEGAGKRRYSITNRPEYNDGVHYTMSLAKNGFKNIHLLPDASFYSLAYDLKCKKQLTRENSLLLFGANGVSSKDKSCGHTSGHMVMAITAKQFGIPLKIVTDSFKFGKIIWNSDLKRYGTEWLAGDLEFINELQQHNIKLINYREDSIPPNFIDEIITEQSKKILPSAGC